MDLNYKEEKEETACILETLQNFKNCASYHPVNTVAMEKTRMQHGMMKKQVAQGLEQHHLWMFQIKTPSELPCGNR
ncbi:hypothetical protein GQ457_06G017580 [Hibiscus cannabinus]